MTTHANCTHPATKAARTACRRLSAKGYDQLHPAFDPPKPAAEPQTIAEKLRSGTVDAAALRAAGKLTAR